MHRTEKDQYKLASNFFLRLAQTLCALSIPDFQEKMRLFHDIHDLIKLKKPIQLMQASQQDKNEEGNDEPHDVLLPQANLPVTDEKIFCITTDNASSNSTFVQRLTDYCDSNGLDFKLDNWIRCLAHVINLSVKEALKHFKPLLAKLHKLVKAVRASPQRLKKLKEFCGTENNVDKLVPILDVDTRWSSSFEMIERALKIKTALDSLTNSERDLRRLELEDEEWTLLIEIQSFLKPFAEITRVAEGSTFPTLVFAVPLYNSLMIVLDGYEEEKDDFVHDFLIIDAARSANLKLKAYYNKTTSIYLIATILDPRLKLEYFKDNE
ncbi:hypothetical protein GHT06_018669 [Daphnia sinensis]|uniref:Uncharacterized protein n=1 Tax=Daphnia sinensis TaxID=1820382 RepID=A0AAD5PR14_9CRUS|nr:hypothetical protein GHT06_018669 [Daphnia sinensis]